MPAPKGNKFSKGVKNGKTGRKGYEYEQAQLKKMRQILNRALVMAERLQLGKAEHRELMAYENSLKLVLKIMDKLHANRQEVKVEGGGEPIKISWEK